MKLRTQAGLSVGHRDVHVVLLAMLVDREALKVDVPARAKLRLHGPGQVDGRLEAQISHAVLDHLEVYRNDAGHLDGAAEGDLAVALCVFILSVDLAASGKCRRRLVNADVLSSADDSSGTGG